MPDITRLVLLEHETLRRQFADLDDAEASGELSAITAAWSPLAALLDLHAETEEQVFYPRLLEHGVHAEDETEDAIDDHNKIRDGVRDAGDRAPGSPEWWEAVDRAREENSKHIAEEERGAVCGTSASTPMSPCATSSAGAGSSTAPNTSGRRTSNRSTRTPRRTSPSTNRAEPRAMPRRAGETGVGRLRRRGRAARQVRRRLRRRGLRRPRRAVGPGPLPGGRRGRR